jgi:hypothetical protein
VREGEKREREGKIIGRVERKKKKERKKMGEMVGDQTAKQATKPLKKGEREKKTTGSVNSRIEGLVVFSSLVSCPVCVALRHAWSTLVAAPAGVWWSL